MKTFKFKVTPVGWISVDTNYGDEWVLFWADEEITDPDGLIDSHYAHEGFKIKGGKIITVNQYYRPKLNLYYYYKKPCQLAGFFIIII